MSWNGLKNSSHNLQGQHVQGGAVEGWFKSDDLIEEHSEGPNIGFEVVRGVFNDLRREIVRSADYGLCHLRCGLQDFGDTEISQFHYALLGEEDVLAL